MEGVSMALTTIGHHNLKPKKADDRVTDGGGLYIHILVSPNGSNLWRYDYRLGACRRTRSIGEWGEGPNRVSLKQARDAHDEARAAVARGEHPIGQKFAVALAEIEKACVGRQRGGRGLEGVHQQAVTSKKARGRIQTLLKTLEAAPAACL
jgi:hypothetical protein